MDSPDAIQAATEGFTHGLITGIGSTAAIIVVAVIIWIRYPNNVKLVLAQIWSALSYIFGVFAERYYIINHLEGRLGKGIENITAKIDGLEADGIKITLVRNASREAFIRNRVLLMRIQRKDNHEENLANIAYLYSEHLYSRLKPSLNAIQKEGIELYTAKSILQLGGGEGVRFLDETYYRPMVAHHPQLQTLLNQLEVLDGKGLFFSVFIQEMVFLGEKTMFRQSARGVHQEVGRFVQFLVDFANRPRGDAIVEKDFRGQNIKLSFVLVAVRANREADLTQVYVNYVRGLPRDTESFYFMGWGENVAFVRHVVEDVIGQIDYLELKKEKGYERFFEDGSRVDAVCILARNTHVAALAEPVPATTPTPQMATLPGANQRQSRRG